MTLLLLQRPSRGHRLAVVATALAVLLAGCGPGTEDRSAVPAPTADAGRTTPVPGATFATVGCADAPAAFTLLCEAHALIRDEHVDAPADERLAAAAAAGVPTDAAPATRGSFDCAVPTDAFRVLCDALAAAGGADPAAVEDAVRAMVAGSLDPYSAYQDADERERAESSIDGTFEGIGALVTSERVGDQAPSSGGDTPAADRCTELSPTCAVVIVEVFDGSPARAAGLAAGDRIVAVDADPVDGGTLGGVVDRVRGPAGTTVRLTVEQDGRRRQLTVARAAVDVPVVESTVVDDVLYVRLGLFTEDADDQLRRTLADRLDRDTRAVVLDLRGNPGGTLTSAIGVASQFLSSGEVVRLHSARLDRTYRVDGGGLATTPSLDVHVVVDRASASASEVVAGALQEAGRATVVGRTTFGKDTVQQTFPLADGGALKLTVARWLTPAGRGLHEGVAPDVELDLDATGPEALVAAVLTAVGRD